MSDDVTLRTARETDVRQVGELVRAFHAEAGIETPEDDAMRAVRGLLASTDPDPGLGRVWFVESGARVVGYAALTFGWSIEIGGRDAFLDELWVDPAHRGRGVGARALDLVAEAARSMDVRALHLEVARDDASARRLYARAGFAARDRYHLMTRRFHYDP